MNISDLKKIIADDLKIDKSKIDAVAAEAPAVTQKYINLFHIENGKLTKLERDLDALIKEKAEFYSAEYHIIPETQKQLFVMINGDDDIIKKREEIDRQKNLVRFVESTIDNFKHRMFMFKNIIDYLKFISGE